jgi:hypothetical protein
LKDGRSQLAAIYKESELRSPSNFPLFGDRTAVSSKQSPFLFGKQKFLAVKAAVEEAFQP